MAFNSGTLIISPIRPNATTDTIATALSNEVQGGHHQYTTIVGRNSITPERRVWGMLCTVYAEATTTLNGVYQLVRGASSTDITENGNWVLFQRNANPDTGTSLVDNEWLNSVISVRNTAPSSPNDFDRYLVSATAISPWLGKEGYIAQWSAAKSAWAFIAPVVGNSVRSDAESSVIYRYTQAGWMREALNQVYFITASSTNGISFTASSVTPTLDDYTNKIFNVTFGTVSSGASRLAINSLTSTPIYKMVGSITASIGANDLSTGLQYQLSYNGSSFLVNLPSTGQVAIGPSPQVGGAYTNGVYSDFVAETAIGTPVDRFNRLLLNLVPPTSPNLNTWSITSSNTLVEGKMSYDNSAPVTGYASATASVYGSVAKGGLFSTASSYRLGVISSVGAFTPNLSGVLNNTSATVSLGDILIYPEKMIGDADTGTVSLVINNFTASSINLGSTIAAISDISGGLSASAVYYSNFFTGLTYSGSANRKIEVSIPNSKMVAPYSTSFQGILINSSGFTRGFNQMIVKHQTSTTISVVSQYEFILDNDITATTVTAATISQISLSGSKWLSGLQYYTGGSINYTATLNNVYRNTYYPYSDAIQLFDTVTQSNTSIVPTFGTISLAYTTPNTSNDSFVISNYPISLSSGIRKMNEALSVGVVAKRTVQPILIGGTASLGGFYIDGVSPTSTDTFEGFDDERYRLQNPISQYTGSQYSTTVSIASGVWNSETSLKNGGGGYNMGLQVNRGGLSYPNIDHNSVVSNLARNLNFNVLSTAYLTSSGNMGIGGSGTKSYVRYFRNSELPTISSCNYIIKFQGSAVDFVPVSNTLIAAIQPNRAWVEIKLPGASSQQTGWLDCAKAYNNGLVADGDGALVGNIGGNDTTGLALNKDWGITTGTYSTANSSEYILMRITVGPSFVGNLSSIEFNFV
jgi:hypothetical protein